MRTQQLVKRFLQSNYETCKAKELADDHGIRIRVQQDGKVELATTYFYESQNQTASLYNSFEKFAADNDIKVEPEFVGHPISRQISFNGKPWPKTSWATMIITVLEA